MALGETEIPLSWNQESPVKQSKYENLTLQTAETMGNIRILQTEQVKCAQCQWEQLLIYEDSNHMKVHNHIAYIFIHQTRVLVYMNVWECH